MPNIRELIPWLDETNLITSMLATARAMPDPSESAALRASILTELIGRLISEAPDCDRVWVADHMLGILLEDAKHELLRLDADGSVREQVRQAAIAAKDGSLSTLSVADYLSAGGIDDGQ
jgi:hypothetical protein